MSYAASTRFSDPMAEMNTTPLIDVLLVLLIMFIIAIPLSDHSVEIELPYECLDCNVLDPLPIINKVSVDEAGTVFWNAIPTDRATLARTLAATREMPVEPELQFEPAANAGYAQTAEVINIIINSGITKFGFVGNERYRQFGRS